MVLRIGRTVIGQIIDSRELQRHAQRWRDGEPITVLVNADSTHAVVIRTAPR